MSDGVICLDALTLADDRRAAYARLRTQIVGEFKTNMERCFNDLQKALWQQYEDKKDELAKVLPRPSEDFRFYESPDKPMEQTGVKGIF